MINKKDAILDSAQDLMLQKGFTATSLDEICENAGVTKGSFFHYFKNKEQLGIQLIDHYALKAAEAVKACVDCCGPDPLNRVMGYIDAATQMCQDPNQQGCLIGSMTQELYTTSPQICCCCGDKLGELRQALYQDLLAAKSLYEVSDDIDLKGLADLFITTFQGGFILAKATGDRQSIQRAIAHYRRYVKSIFGDN